MSSAIRLYKGPFGRASLLEIDKCLVTHAHHHCHVLIKASGPDVSFVVRDRVCTMTSSNALLLNTWEPHTYLHQADQESKQSTIILSLHIEPSWLAATEESLAHVAHPRFFPQPVIELSHAMRHFVDDVIMELWWADAFSENRLQTILFELIARIVGPSRHDTRPQNLYMLPMDRRIKKAISLIHESGFLDFDMDSLARECHLSRAHFFKLFRDQTNVTPSVYTNSIKMEQAFRRLANTDCSVADLSLDLGFSAQGHFTRFFSQHQGITPTEFRRKVQNLG